MHISLDTGLPTRIGELDTATGRRVYLDDPEASEVHIRDIAISLSRMCRANGHLRKFYSVAQHSELVSRVCPPELGLVGLLHDATEAYVQDIYFPLKQLLGDSYHELERRWALRIGREFGLGRSLAELPPEVHMADLRVREAERQDIFPTEVRWRTQVERAPGSRIRPRSPFAAELAFLARYRELSHGK